MLDEITRAVLSRDEIAKYLEGRARRERSGGARTDPGVPRGAADLRSATRCTGALKHPVYLLLRNVERIGENIESPKAATRNGRVVYVSNHRSHCDYLVEPLVLDDNGVRPPVIAAGINLFGGPLGLLNRHVTGAMPIRRNSRDPVYLMTLKAYVAELLRKQDLFFFPRAGAATAVKSSRRRRGC
jgi:glycerol-3-phosphate O-acyltransferase